MKKQQVQLGGTYVAKVSGKLARVRIDAESRFGGWDATNVDTGRSVRIKSAQRLRREVAPTRSAGDDRPPQDIDERIAAAPPSIVPYEQRRARAQRSQAAAHTVALAAAAVPAPEDMDADPDIDGADDLINQPHCATPGCGRPRALIYLDRPMCQACWERHCQEDAPADPPPARFAEANAGETNTVSDAALASAENETREQENDMGSKSKKAAKATKKNVSKPAAKSASTAAPAKAAGVAKTDAPKVGAKVAAAKARSKKATAATKTTGAAKPKRVSALDAAAQVLKAAGKPMRSGELITAMAEKGLWTSPGGKTPEATLYAAMMREARDKKAESRFKKIDRGQFAFNG
ncbi:MAG: hypothetical protein HBSAPP02_23550 [Phycisphaerae bacterium]|nr:MAG: hypothetical protein HBSAPP02_23550 [Phycisphaerae bacterium]